MLETLTPPDPWLTFGPDVLAGVISGLFTGLAVGLILLITQKRTERRAETNRATTDAYVSVLEVLSRMISLDFGAAGESKMLGEFRHRLTVLTELTDGNTPQIAFWFEAERQLSLHRALQSAELTKALPVNASEDEQLEARIPFGRWIAEFTTNLRFWRTGKLTDAQMGKQATVIEASLREKGAWTEPLAWRGDK